MNQLVKLLLPLVFLGIFLADAPAQEKIKFTKKPMIVGTVVNEAHTTIGEDKQSVSMGGRVQNKVEKTSEKNIKIITVLAVENKEVVQIKVTFKTKEETIEHSGDVAIPKKTKTSLLTGKTFLVSYRNGEMTYKLEDGTSPNLEERAALAKNYEKNSKRTSVYNPFQQFDLIIPQREIALGETINADPKDLSAVLGSEGPADIFKKVTLTLREKRTVFGVPCGVFDLKIEMNEEKLLALTGVPGMKGSAAMTGECIVGIDTMWCYSLNAEMSMKLDGSADSPNGKVAIVANSKNSVSALAGFVLPKKK